MAQHSKIILAIREEKNGGIRIFDYFCIINHRFCITTLVIIIISKRLWNDHTID